MEMDLPTESVASGSDAAQLTGWYDLHWHIEVMHRVIKTGCRVESRILFGTFPSLSDSENGERVDPTGPVRGWARRDPRTPFRQFGPNRPTRHTELLVNVSNLLDTARMTTPE